MIGIWLFVKQDDFIGRCSLLLVFIISVNYGISGFLCLYIVAFIAVVTGVWSVEISSAKELKS